MTTTKQLVFGYGTMQHHPNMKAFDRQLSFLDAKYVGDGILWGCMIARIPYGGMVWAGVVEAPDHPRAYVLGEVFEVNDKALEALDRRECYMGSSKPERSVYMRVAVPIVLRATGELVTAWVYTVDHNQNTRRELLTHAWPWTDVEKRRFPDIRSHELLPDEVVS